jgi:uncharacterized membrane protein
LDNLAWIAFAFAVTFIPIAVVTGISESYIALAAILGIVINNEKLVKHQYVGLFLVLISAILLSLTIK